MKNAMNHHRSNWPTGFTLIELLVVVAIIGLLISILLPSLGRAREQAKSVHCIARLSDIGKGLREYANDNADVHPPAIWHRQNFSEADHIDDDFGEYPTNPDYVYHWGWIEILWPYLYKEEVFVPQDFPVQRNVNAKQWAGYFTCRSASERGIHSGHYRVYLPHYAYGTYAVDRRAPWQLTTNDGEPNYPDPTRAASYTQLSPKHILVGDANEYSYRGNNDLTEDGDNDGHDDNDCSYIDAAEANEGGADGNRFSDRHYGYTCFLFADTHAGKDDQLREELARDWNHDGVDDITDAEDQDNDNNHP